MNLLIAIGYRLNLHKKWFYILAVVMLSTSLLYPFVVTSIEIYQNNNNKSLVPHSSISVDRGSPVAVVFYSRSGNTAVVARYLAKKLDAKLFQIDSQQYPLGIRGWFNAIRSEGKREAHIVPGNIDLTDIKTVYIGSPVWFNSPAPPLWAFIRHNRFDGKRVILFNTFNSRFDNTFIEAFRAEVMARGASSFEHFSIRRGRTGQQLSPKQMITEIDIEWPMKNDI